MSDELSESDALHWAAGYGVQNTGNPQKIRPLVDIERGYIEMVIAICHGNIPQAATLLGVSPSTIYRKQARWQKQGG